MSNYNNEYNKGGNYSNNNYGNQQKSTLIKVAGLWANTTKEGLPMFKGYLGEMEIIIITNKSKTAPNHPDFNMFFAPKQPKQTNNVQPTQQSNYQAPNYGTRPQQYETPKQNYQGQNNIPQQPNNVQPTKTYFNARQEVPQQIKQDIQPQTQPQVIGQQVNNDEFGDINI